MGKLIEIPTDSYTQLFLQVAEVTITDEAGERKGGKVIALSLSTDTGSKEDGEQTTYLTAAQAQALREQLSHLTEEINSNMVI